MAEKLNKNVDGSLDQGLARDVALSILPQVCVDKYHLDENSTEEEVKKTLEKIRNLLAIEKPNIQLISWRWNNYLRTSKKILESDKPQGDETLISLALIGLHASLEGAINQYLNETLVWGYKFDPDFVTDLLKKVKPLEFKFTTMLNGVSGYSLLEHKELLRYFKDLNRYRNLILHESGDPSDDKSDDPHMFILSVESNAKDYLKHTEEIIQLIGSKKHKETLNRDQKVKHIKELIYSIKYK